MKNEITQNFQDCLYDNHSDDKHNEILGVSNPSEDVANLSNNNIKSDSFSSAEKEIEYVRIIYGYKAKCEGELTVNINDILKIIDDEIDYDNTWIRAMDCHGTYGVLPSKCVEPILDSNMVFIRKPANRGLFANNDWYFGNISRYETNTLLNKYGKNGDFLVRDSEHNVSIFLNWK